ncbi:fatty acid desaturase [Planomonospora algeriensis]
MSTDAAPLDIGTVRHSTLVDSFGRRYVDFRRGLTPRWGVVWMSLLAGHAGLVLSATAVVLLQGAVSGTAAAVGITLSGGIVFGLCLHYLTTFLHEGAHYNLAPGRRASDRLANALIGVLVGMDVRVYRKVHFDHHRYLGTTRDPERSYFAPLDLRFLAEGLTAVRLFRALQHYRRLIRSKSGAEANGSGPVDRVLPVAALVNASMVGCALWAEAVPLAVAWTIGQLVVLPLINTVRQVLEHRSEFADDAADYTQVPHGPVNRLFGDGAAARVIGSAGFNRHLLHHWDPSVSFTRLREVEEFLMNTEIAPLLRSRQTTYYRTWRQLERI